MATHFSPLRGTTKPLHSRDPSQPQPCSHGPRGNTLFAAPRHEPILFIRAIPSIPNLVPTVPVVTPSSPLRGTNHTSSFVSSVRFVVSPSKPNHCHFEHPALPSKPFAEKRPACLDSPITSRMSSRWCGDRVDAYCYTGNRSIRQVARSRVRGSIPCPCIAIAISSSGFC